VYVFLLLNYPFFTQLHTVKREKAPNSLNLGLSVGSSGLEPLTSALSKQRSEPTELTSFFDIRYRMYLKADAVDIYPIPYIIHMAANLQNFLCFQMNVINFL
jgi:hypothetical protein